MLEEVLPCKTMLSVNATCLSPGAHGILVHAHIKTPLTTMGMQALFVFNSVKLHLKCYYDQNCMSRFILLWVPYGLLDLAVPANVSEIKL